MSPKRLTVWLGDDPVATLEARRPWDLRCRYERSVLDRGEANRPLLSCSLPVTRQAQPAAPWVRGLLPEGQHLLALATGAGVPTNYYADLLQRYGRDIAGAFTISADAPQPRRWDLEPYTGDTLAAELRHVLDAPGFAVRDDSELSIAGLQNKLLVVALDGGWARPRNGHPSTHLLKLGDERYPGMLAAEHACMALARAVGLTTVRTDLFAVDGIEVLAVERYDREIDAVSGEIRRLHQEDACQAIGIDIDADRGRGKYESSGGPSYVQIANLLERYGDPVAELPRLLRKAVFTAAIGDADAHGKNVSFLIDTASGAVTLAPLYDTVPTVLWPRLRTAASMTVNGSRALPSWVDLVAEARAWGLAGVVADRVLEDAVAELRGALAACEHAAVAELVTDRLDTLERSG